MITLRLSCFLATESATSASRSTSSARAVPESTQVSPMLALTPSRCRRSSNGACSASCSTPANAMAASGNATSRISKAN